MQLVWHGCSYQTGLGGARPKSSAATNSELSFVNAIMSAVLDAFGVRVKHGAVRHPQ